MRFLYLSSICSPMSLYRYSKLLLVRTDMQRKERDRDLMIAFEELALVIESLREGERRKREEGEGERESERAERAGREGAKSEISFCLCKTRTDHLCRLYPALAMAGSLRLLVRAKLQISESIWPGPWLCRPISKLYKRIRSVTDSGVKKAGPRRARERERERERARSH